MYYRCTIGCILYKLVVLQNSEQSTGTLVYYRVYYRVFYRVYPICRVYYKAIGFTIWCTMKRTIWCTIGCTIECTIGFTMKCTIWCTIECTIGCILYKLVVLQNSEQSTGMLVYYRVYYRVFYRVYTIYVGCTMKWTIGFTIWCTMKRTTWCTVDCTTECTIGLTMKYIIWCTIECTIWCIRINWLYSRTVSRAPPRWSLNTPPTPRYENYTSFIHSFVYIHKKIKMKIWDMPWNFISLYRTFLYQPSLDNGSDQLIVRLPIHLYTISWA